MRLTTVLLSCLLVAGVFLVGGIRAEPSTPAMVLSSGDGDTLRVRQAGHTITVRLACIDAPEMAQRPYGPKAREYLRLRLPLGRAVTLKGQTTDRFGRIVAEVFGGSNIGLAMVEDGQAFVYRKYLSQCNAEEYLAAEDRARQHRYGVWQVPGGITRPWDFRHGHTSEQRSSGRSVDTWAPAR